MSYGTALYLTVDGHRWEVVRRHEMAQLMSRRRYRDRKLFLFFYGSNGELRRSEIPEDFPQEPAPSVLESVLQYSEQLSPPSPGEMQSHATLSIPSFGNTLKLMWRAIRLRCPNCGSRGVLKSWFTLNTQCRSCGIRFERGESQDYFLGGMMFNIILAEFIFAVGFVTTLVVMWPDVPWDNLEYILAACAIAAPIILYPFSRVIWLAFDLLLRPVTPEEMQWHRESGNGGESGAKQ